MEAPGSRWERILSFGRKGSESPDYEGFEGPNLDTFGFIQKILITVLSNYDNSNCVSIAELRFDINPLACYGTEDVCGVCDGPGMITWYEDADDDELGNPDVSMEACEQPIGYVANADDPCDTGLYGWADIQMLLDDNGCTGCHSNPGASGLDLTTYEGITAGGINCGSSLLTGDVLVSIITIDGYDGCSAPVSFPSMNERVGGALDTAEIAMIQAWVNAGAPYDCNCPPGSPDNDNDGVCDASDDCPGFDNDLIGTSCDDGDPCTTNDIYQSTCQCEGQQIPDSDFDGVCDSVDLAPSNPCTADGVVGLPEPQGWVASPSNDCDQDGIPLEEGDLDDFDACIDDEGTSLAPECLCPGSAIQSGGKLVADVGIWGTSAYYAQGLPDGNLSGGIGWEDYIELAFPYMEIGQEICFDVGFNSVDGGVRFEINELGSYKFLNPDTNKINYEIQQVCFPVFAPGDQLIRITRWLTGSVKIDGATFDHCPCTLGDPKIDYTHCRCPNDFSSGPGTFIQGGEITDPQNADGAPDGVFTGWTNGADSVELSYPSLPANTEICVVIAFDNAAGKVGFTLEGDYFEVANQTGSTDKTVGQDICFLTTTSGPQHLKIKEEGSGSIFIDGSYYKSCNSCDADTDNDSVCDDVDACPGFDDFADADSDGIPDGCDDCDSTLAGTTCNDDDPCTANDVYDTDCNCAGTFADDDNDGVCNADDICPGGNDSMDGDGDGIPDFCDTCDGSLNGVACNDNDPCTINDVYDVLCNCAGTFADDDNDGVCNADDICPGGNDALDGDGDGIPDFCDDCNNALTGTACDDADPCTVNDAYDVNCNCAGTFADDDNDGVCNVDDICPGGDDSMDGDGDGIPDFCDDCDGSAPQTCDDGDPCTVDDVYDVDCNCAGTFVDDDNDGVCNADDICPGGDDALDGDGDGIPDFCDDCDGSLNGIVCDDGDPCTVDDVYDVDCNCAGTFADDDNDGVCNADDICPGGNDALDGDGDGIPDFCDDCDGSLNGVACDDGDPCTVDDVYDVECNCAGTFADDDNDGVCNADDICPGGDDALDGDGDGIPDFCDDCDGSLNGVACDDGDLCTVDDVYDVDCNCAGTFADDDNDGVCNADDICPGGNDALDGDGDGIPDFCDDCDGSLNGFVCDDGNPCTVDDVYDVDCNCAGTFADDDNDGVCNADDICPGGDDALDGDGDGIPDFCDDCDGSLTGVVCNDGDPCTVDDVYDVDCNCAGTFADDDNDGVCNADDICPGGDDALDGDGDGIPDFCDDCDGSLNGIVCDDGDPCTVDDVYDVDCNCAGTFADDDNDGVCNADDICPGGDDALDGDGDGIPDFCDDCDGSLNGVACDDGDPCTVDDVYDVDCNCAGTFADDDNDGVCNADDICPGGDDALDGDGDGIPDFCDDCDGSLTGVVCNDGDPCTVDDVYDVDCNCAGTFADDDNDGVCNADDICPGGDDALDGDGDGIPDFCDDCDGSLNGIVCDDGDPCTVDDVYDVECNCAGTFVDDDNDGVCNADDICPGGDDNLDGDGDGIPDFCDDCDGSLTGVVCDDGDPCTVDDVYDVDCNCAGTFVDDDNDGVCNADDICPGGNDALDGDGDGIPDFCDDCDGSLTGVVCDDDDPCTVDDVYDVDCNCVGTFADDDNDGVCNADDICPGGNDALDGDGDGIPDFCDDCDGSLNGVVCDDGDPCTVDDVYDVDCNCAGTFADDDNDGVCNADDICPGGDDNLDGDGDGIPDFCDDCFTVVDSFEQSILAHSGAGSTLITLNLVNRSDVAFTVSDLGSNTTDDSSSMFIEVVEISYIDGDGNAHVYGTYSGADQAVVDVFIFGVVQKVIVSLKDDYDGDAPEMRVALSESKSCIHMTGLESDAAPGANLPQELILYPNPTLDEFFVRFTAIKDQIYELTVLDAVGRPHFKKEVKGMLGETIVGLSGLELEAGIYFVNLDSNKRRINTKRLVVVKK